jgi:hypothetical protein
MPVKAICLLLLPAAIVFLSGSFAANAWAEKPDLSCRYSLKDAPLDAPKFSDFPAPAEHIASPAPLDFRGNGKARQYRAILRDAAQRGPNFAGRYTIADIGCGSSCSYWAMIDERTGKISFYPALESIAGAQVDDYRLQHRVDSNLLILLGGPRKNETHGGIFYYRWDGNNFHQLRFVPAGTICKER